MTMKPLLLAMLLLFPTAALAQSDTTVESPPSDAAQTVPSAIDRTTDALQGFGSVRSVDDVMTKGSTLISALTDATLAHLPYLFMTVVTLFVGLFAIRLVLRLANRAFHVRAIDAAVQSFLVSLLGIGLKILLFITVLGMVGVPTASLGFVVGAASLAVGIAMKDTLANFAGGVMILLLKPYQIGNFIEGAGYTGSVREIQIFNTILTTGDNRRIIIPNGQLAATALINYSTESTRRVEAIFGIGYDDNIGAARDVLQGIIDADPRSLAEPAPTIKVCALGASSVDLQVRVWVKSSDNWSYKLDLLEKTKLAFDEAGISFPYPQTEVTMRQVTN
jgi:small conductance mechanosensitive channel